MSIFKPDHLLHGAVQKIIRAQDHLDLVKLKIEPFTEGKCEVAIEYQNDPDGGSSTLKFATDDPGADLAVIVGDCLFCLRSALDHIVWALVLANGKKPGICNQFPICSSCKNFAVEVQKGRLRGVSDKALAVVEGLQPYNGSPNPLGMLNSLHNVDKHRSLKLASLSIDSIDLTWREAGEEEAFSYHLSGDGLTDGTELLHDAVAFGLSGSGDVQVSGKATATVVFKDEPCRGYVVGTALDETLQFMKRTVIPAFEPLFP